jgi:hypothetical protein
LPEHELQYFQTTCEIEGYPGTVTVSLPWHPDDVTREDVIQFLLMVSRTLATQMGPGGFVSGAVDKSWSLYRNRVEPVQTRVEPVQEPVEAMQEMVEPVQDRVSQTRETFSNS